MDNKYEIGGRTFAFGTIPPTKAVVLEIEIAKLIGEPLFKAFAGADKKLSKRQETEAGAAAIGLLCSKADPDSLLRMMQTVFEYTSCDGQRVNMDATFVGRNRELLQVFIAGLKYNFHDFFPASLLDSLRAKMPASL